MTVNTIIITSGPYTGNGLSDQYSYDFRVKDKNQLSVYETNDNGVRTLLTVDTDYTVAGIGDAAGGILTRVAGNLPTNYIWYIRSNYIENQLTAFRSQGGFLPKVHEDQFDHQTFLIQQILDTRERSFRLSDEVDIDGDFTIDDDAAARAYKTLTFDSLGNLIADSFSVGVLSDGVVVSNKASAAVLSLTAADDGKKIFITSTDGGEFTVRYNATPGTYADNGGTYTGTVFIPSGGDGTIGIVRDYIGSPDPLWFGETHVWDSFNRPDGLLNGSRSDSGVKWSIGGAGAATAAIVNNRFVATDNSYAALNNGEAISRMSGKFSFDLEDGTYTRGGTLVVLIADKANGSLSDMLHCICGPNSWTLTKRIAGGAFINVSGGTHHLLTNGAVYEIAMEISGNTVTIIPPQGKSVSVTDTDVGVINPSYGIFQITANSGGRWESVDMGGPIDLLHGNEKTTFLMGASLSERRGLRDIVLDQGIGWYRIAEEGVLNTFAIAGKMKLGFGGSAGSGVIEFEASAAHDYIHPSIKELYSFKHGTSAITKIRISTTSGSKVVIDIYNPASGDVIINADSFGTFDLLDVPTFGVSALATGERTITIGDTEPALGVTQSVRGLQLAGGVGWYRIANHGTLGTFMLAGKMKLKFTSGASGYAEIDFSAVHNTVAPTLTQEFYHSTGGQGISQVRLSNTSGVGVALDVYLPNAAALTLDIDYYGTLIIDETPTVGATALLTKSQVLTLLNDVKVVSIVKYLTGAGDYSGSGTPEGAVSAVPGSTFRRRDGGAGTSFYVKESGGGGSTGWVAK